MTSFRATAAKLEPGKKSQREEVVALSVLRLLQLNQVADETNCSINEHAAFHRSRSDYQAAHQDVARLYSVLAICCADPKDYHQDQCYY